MSIASGVTGDFWICKLVGAEETAWLGARSIAIVTANATVARLKNSKVRSKCMMVIFVNVRSKQELETPTTLMMLWVFVTKSGYLRTEKRIEAKGLATGAYSLRIDSPSCLFNALGRTPIALKNSALSIK